MKPFHTIVDILDYIENCSSKEKALNRQNHKGEWSSLSTANFVKEVRYAAVGMHKLGIKEGDCVGILANSSPRWSVADCAIMLLGAISVPLFANISNENFEFEVDQAAIKHLFIDGDEQWEMFEKHKSHFDIVIQLYNDGENKEAISFDDLLKEGEILAQNDPSLLQSIEDKSDPDKTASIVYTSGSTGQPKGVMLSQNILVALAHLNPFNWDDNQSYVSVLPLAHIFARTFNLMMIAKRAEIYYVRDIKTVGDVCREIKPTILAVVPRLLEKVYAKMVAKVHEAPLIKRAIGNLAFHMANNQEKGLLKRILSPILDKLVYSKLREALGGNLVTVISGGAALPPHLYHFLLNIGLPIYEGWGLTEACPITLNPVEEIRVGSIGTPLEGMEVKVSPNGELLVKGPNVMQGYYKNEKATKEAFTEDGWLKTGDTGSKDREGYLSIRGRLKEMYKTSTGKWIAPVPIELELCKAPLIDMAMVIGDGKKYASCLIFPDFEVVQKLKKRYRKESLSDEEFLAGGDIKQEMDNILNKLNKHLNHWEELHGYRFVPTSPTIGGGELTPTMKIRREIVYEKYRHLIDSIYVQEAT